MEKIIVLIDMETKTVNLFGEYNKTFSIYEAHLIKPFLEGRTAYYVVQAEETDGDEVLQTISDFAQQTPLGDGEIIEEKKFLRIKQDGYISIPEIRVRFSGPKDAKSLDILGYDIFEKSPTLKALYIADKVEVITESQAKSLRKPRPNQSRDKALESMILNKKIEDFQDDNDMFPKTNEPGENDVDGPGDIESDTTYSLKIIKGIK